MPAIYINKHSKLGFQISACVNGNKDVFYKTQEDPNFPEKEPGAKFFTTKHNLSYYMALKWSNFVLIFHTEYLYLSIPEYL